MEEGGVNVIGLSVSPERACNLCALHRVAPSGCRSPSGRVPMPDTLLGAFPQSWEFPDETRATTRSRSATRSSCG